MGVQVITTEAGEELIVLPRRDYDVLLARLGDDDAEDRMTTRMVDEARRRRETGEDAALPAYISECVLNGHPAVRGVRLHAGLTLAAMAERVQMTEADLSASEAGRRTLTADERHRIAVEFHVEPSWLED